VSLSLYSCACFFYKVGVYGEHSLLRPLHPLVAFLQNIFLRGVHSPPAPPPTGSFHTHLHLYIIRLSFSPWTPIHVVFKTFTGCRHSSAHPDMWTQTLLPDLYMQPPRVGSPWGGGGGRLFYLYLIMGAAPPHTRFLRVHFYTVVFFTESILPSGPSTHW
jgi:hypothetical protein